MSRSKARLQVCLGAILAIPAIVCAGEGAAARISGAADPVMPRLELAAAIGIIPSAPEAEKKPEVPVQPVEAAPPPVAQQEEEPIPEESQSEESEGVTKTQILLGVGVAALLGALGGGGGGGSSSTPSH